MKLRHAFIFAGITLIIAACNFTLAADVTPPPGYVPPTPMPTLGPLFPASAPDTDKGAAIYAEKCSPCHGVSGLGDGEQGKQLPVTVAAFALPETAHKASPAGWFTMVSQGNLDRFMPPFTSLSEQERWDVVSYALTLHTTPEMIEKGRSLFEGDCFECHAEGFTQEFMAGKSAENIAYIISKGQGDMKAIDMAEDDMYAVAAYMRTQTFALPATPTPVPATEAPVTAEAGTPSTEGTPVEGTQIAITPEATNVAGIGNVSGSIDNQTGAALPSDLKVTLRGYEHGGDPSAGPQEIVTLESTVNADGTYLFENVEIPEKRIFIAELDLDGITYQSEFAVVEAGATELKIPALKLYGTTTELTNLVMDSVFVHFDFTSPDSIGVFIVYSMRNTGNKTISVILENNKQDIPFIKAPANTQGLGFQTTQDSASLIGTEDGSGFFMLPTEQAYELVAFTNLPKSDKVEFSQAFVLAVESAHVFVPEGVIASGDQLIDAGLVPLQGPDGQTVNYQTYSADNIKANETLTFTLSGKPRSTTVNPDVTQNKSLLIGVGALGLALILAGAWLYWRDRKRVEEQDEEEGEFEDPESLMDAIIALDDLHRAGKLTDEAHKQRRDELKNALKRKS